MRDLGQNTAEEESKGRGHRPPVKIGPSGNFRAGLRSPLRPHSANIGVDRYRSPVSGSSTTMVLPSFSGRLAC